MTIAGTTLLAMTIALQSGAGIILNSCIACFSFQSLKNGNGLYTTNLIYLVMGVINISLQGLLTAQNTIHVFVPCLFRIKELGLTLAMLALTVAYCSFWLTAWLCAHYCVTIASFGHHLIGWFRRLLSSFLPHILVLSLIGPSLMGALSVWMVNVTFHEKPPTNCTHNCCVSSAAFYLSATYKVLSIFLGCCLPFTLALISTGITISSLIRHIKNMNHSGLTHTNLQALINAARTMLLFLGFSVIFYVFELLFCVTFTGTSAGVTSLLSSFIIMSFPLAEAIIIIQATPKLREKFWETFCCEKRRKIEENT